MKKVSNSVVYVKAYLWKRNYKLQIILFIWPTQWNEENWIRELQYNASGNDYKRKYCKISFARKDLYLRFVNSQINSNVRGALKLTVYLFLWWKLFRDQGLGLNNIMVLRAKFGDMAFCLHIRWKIIAVFCYELEREWEVSQMSRWSKGKEWGLAKEEIWIKRKNTFQIWTMTKVKRELVEEEVEEEVCWHLPVPVCSQPLKGGHPSQPVSQDMRTSTLFGPFLQCF